MIKIQNILFIAILVSAFTTVYGQDSTQTEKDLRIFSVIPGNTKMVITGVTWFGFQSNLNRSNNTIPKTTFNDFGFSPMFLYKLSDRLFFESEIEIKNDGTADNSAAVDLEYAKLSYTLNKFMTIGAGKMLSPFGAYNERWEPNHIERFPNAPFRPDDGLLKDDSHLFWGAVMGMDVRGCIPMGSAKMNYVLYVCNGPKLHTEPGMGGMIQYENWNDNNSNKEIGGRIGILPFSNSSLELGLSGKYGIASNEGDPVYKNIGAAAYAIDYSFVKSIDEIKSNINIRGQFTSLSVDKANYQLADGTPYTFDNTLQSSFTQFSIRPTMVSSKFLRKTELMFRYCFVTTPVNTDWYNYGGVGGTTTRVDLGLTYWLNWRTGLRFAYETETMPDGTKQNGFFMRIATGL